MKQFIIYISTLALLLLSACKAEQKTEKETEEPQHTIIYGIIADDYRTEQGRIASGETMGTILNRYGVSPIMIDRLDKASRDIFPLRQIRADRPYTAFLTTDSLTTDSIPVGRLDYLVYEKDLVEYVIFGFKNDSITIEKGEKEVTLCRQKRTATIDTSLWGAITSISMTTGMLLNSRLPSPSTGHAPPLPAGNHRPRPLSMVALYQLHPPVKTPAPQMIHFRAPNVKAGG